MVFEYFRTRKLNLSLEGGSSRRLWEKFSPNPFHWILWETLSMQYVKVNAFSAMTKNYCSILFNITCALKPCNIFRWMFIWLAFLFCFHPFYNFEGDTFSLIFQLWSPNKTYKGIYTWTMSVLFCIWQVETLIVFCFFFFIAIHIRIAPFKGLGKNVIPEKSCWIFFFLFCHTKCHSNWP